MEYVVVESVEMMKKLKISVVNDFYQIHCKMCTLVFLIFSTNFEFYSSIQTVQDYFKIE